jgi:hypothetical protein
MQDLTQGLKQFAINWNNQFPLDRWWREKYKIPFGSTAHLEANQVDILIEYIEVKAYEDHSIQMLEKVQKKERYKKAGWISQNEVPEEVDDEEYDNIKIPD